MRFAHTPPSPCPRTAAGFQPGTSVHPGVPPRKVAHVIVRAGIVPAAGCEWCVCHAHVCIRLWRMCTSVCAFLGGWEHMRVVAAGNALTAACWKQLSASWPARRSPLCCKVSPAAVQQHAKEGTRHLLKHKRALSSRLWLYGISSTHPALPPGLGPVAALASGPCPWCDA